MKQALAIAWILAYPLCVPVYLWISLCHTAAEEWDAGRWVRAYCHLAVASGLSAFAINIVLAVIYPGQTATP